MSSNRQIQMNFILLVIGVAAAINAAGLDFLAELGGRFRWHEWGASALIATIAFGAVVVVGGNNKIRWAGFVCLACLWFASYRAAEQFLTIVVKIYAP